MHFVKSEFDCQRCFHHKREHKAHGWSLYDVCQKPGCECAQFDPPPWKSKNNSSGGSDNKKEVKRY
jgi:hypothetical protein